MKQYLYKISLFLGFLALGTPHLQATKIVFQYEKDEFNTLRLLEKSTDAQVGDYFENPDIHAADLVVTTNGRLFNNAMDFLMPVEGGDTPSPMLFQDIYGAALKLFKAAARDKPQTVVFLGRSPTFIKETLQQLYALERKKDGPSLVQVAFSGSPDIKSKNPGVQNFSYLRNVLTPKRVKVFFQYLDSLGFDKIQGEMWAVDTVDSGGGLNSFLRLLKGYYLEKKIPFPDFRFWGTSLPEYSVVSETGTVLFDYEKKMISFSDKFSKFGYKAMDIPAASLFLHHRTQGLMDHDLVEYCCGGVQEYHAWKMKGLDKNPIPPQTPGVDFTLFRDRILIPVMKTLHARGARALDPLNRPERHMFMMELLRWVPLEDVVVPSARDTLLPALVQQKCSKFPDHEKREALVELKLELMLQTYAGKEQALVKPSLVYSPESASKKF